MKTEIEGITLHLYATNKDLQRGILYYVVYCHSMRCSNKLNSSLSNSTGCQCFKLSSNFIDYNGFRHMIFNCFNHNLKGSRTGNIGSLKLKFVKALQFWKQHKPYDRTRCLHYAAYERLELASFLHDLFLCAGHLHHLQSR